MWPHERFPHCRVVQVWRLLVHWQAYLPKRARKQAAVRLCGALLVSFWFDDSKTRRAVDRCRRQNHDNLPSRTDGALNGRPGLYFRAAVRRRKGSPLGQLVVVSNRARRVRRGIQRCGSLGGRVRGCHWNNELERRIILLGWSGIKLDRRHTSRPINPTRHLTLLFCAHGVYCGNGRMGTILAL